MTLRYKHSGISGFVLITHYDQRGQMTYNWNCERVLTIACILILAGLRSAAMQERHITVAKSGGEFNSIQSAIDSLQTTTASAVVIDVMPGLYMGNIRMKDGVHLIGHNAHISGDHWDRPIIDLNSRANAVIEGFRIDGARFIPGPGGTVPPGAGTGVYVDHGGSIVVQNNEIVGSNVGIVVSNSRLITVTENRVVNVETGIGSIGNVDLHIERNFIRGAYVRGITIAGSNDLVQNNILEAEGATAVAIGIEVFRSNPLISGNSIHNYPKGVSVAGWRDGKPVIVDNVITGDGYGIITSGTWSQISRNTVISNRSVGIFVQVPPPNAPAGVTPLPLIDHNTTTSIATDAASQEKWTGTLNVTLDGRATPPLATYKLTNRTTQELTVTTRKHAFCWLTRIQFQPLDAGTNRWCWTMPNPDGTWVLKARSGGNAETDCECSCY